MRFSAFVGAAEKMFYVYILECFCDNKANSFYVGYTHNLQKRVQKHQNRQAKTTKKFDKIKLVYYEACLNKTDARKRENQLKTGFGRGYFKKRVANYLSGVS